MAERLEEVLAAFLLVRQGVTQILPEVSLRSKSTANTFQPLLASMPATLAAMLVSPSPRRSCSATSPPTGAQHRLPCPPRFFPIPGVPGRATTSTDVAPSRTVAPPERLRAVGSAVSGGHRNSPAKFLYPALVLVREKRRLSFIRR